MKGFSGKVAAITGAGSGMGRSLAVELARRGCEIALADVNEAGLATTAAVCAQHGVHVSTRRLDVADRDAVFAWADFVRAEHGKVNLIFNNAGVSLAASAETARLADLEWIVGINFWGVVHGTQAFLPHLRASGDGHVVNTSSLFGLVAMPTQSAYNATKFAVRGFTEALRMELELDGAPVSATCVHPGGVATNIVDAGRVDAGIHALTGQDEATHRRQANRLINATTADEAARQILAGVERNARRVLVGTDARRLDRIARVLGAGYQWLMVRHVRRARARNLERAHAPTARPPHADPGPRMTSTTTDRRDAPPAPGARRDSADNRDLDVLIVGAGLSGIGAAYHLKQRCPHASVAIVEARDAIGGTWDLFRYPGVRSDSDMFTLGYSFRPWHSDKAISDGQTILDYIRDTARTYGIDKTIRYGHKVVAADWDSNRARWTVRIERTQDGATDTLVYTCRFLFMCSGYYDYDAGYLPDWAGMDTFEGTLVHPQHWPKDLSYANRRVVVIGSGATAVTLVPSMAADAQHVTMLQRSPTYIVSLPARDKIANALRRALPSRLAHRLVRVKNVLLTMYLYNVSRRKPEQTKKFIIRAAGKQLGPDFDVAKHLTPRYMPWDQRVCLVPNGDLFKAIRAGRASIVTDEIERFTPTGLALKSGQQLDADVIVTATGLKVKLLGGARVTVDGRAVDLPETVSYKGMMYSDVPNLASSFGYTNASWTLKAELIARYVCRLLNHMRANGYDTCVPRLRAGDLGDVPAVNLSSGYIQRAAGILPKQGHRKPWKFHQNYVLDLASLKFSALADSAMHFERRAQAAPGATAPATEPALETR